MNPKLIFFIFIIYTCLLFIITWITSRKSSNLAFFIGNKQSPWFVVAYGMIGASLSGVTFMSVPGWVMDTQFTYMMVVIGYLAGYTVIATILLPLYYRLNLTSIYTYLEQRFGITSYKTGSLLFIVSRCMGASLRMFLVVNVLYSFVFSAWNVPFWLCVAIFIILILLYTFEGGIKTIIWTDTLQTTFMLLAVVFSVVVICKDLNFSLSKMLDIVFHSGYARIINSDITSRQFFLKQFFSGAFITIVMTGLDQEMMQKNLSCRNIKDAQKNMFTFSAVLVVVNLLFLLLGAVLVLYMQTKGVKLTGGTDTIFPTVALKYMGLFPGIIFLIGLISAAYPSADGALTSLTTAFCIDILGVNKKNNLKDKDKIHIRYSVHMTFAVILFFLILFFSKINDRAVIDKIFTIAGYTYGPLLGLYAFGLFTKWQINDRYVPIIAIVSPFVCFILDRYSVLLLWGYKFGFELLILNGLLTFIGLWIIRLRNKTAVNA
jgi:Na+/proline symporter